MRDVDYLLATRPLASVNVLSSILPIRWAGDTSQNCFCIAPIASVYPDTMQPLQQ